MPWLMTLFSRSEWNLGWRLWVMLSDGYIYISGAARAVRRIFWVSAEMVLFRFFLRSKFPATSLFTFCLYDFVLQIFFIPGISLSLRVWGTKITACPRWMCVIDKGIEFRSRIQMNFSVLSSITLSSNILICVHRLVEVFLCHKSTCD